MPGFMSEFMETFLSKLTEKILTEEVVLQCVKPHGVPNRVNLIEKCFEQREILISELGDSMEKCIEEMLKACK